MEIEKRLSGTTWVTYIHILTSKKPQGVREVWRTMNLSTPSLAQYHIDKLLDMGFIETTPDGKYRANRKERIAVLQDFILLRGWLIPRLVFYDSLLLGILLMYVLLWPIRWDFRDIVVFTVSIFSVSAFYFEAFNQYTGLLKR